MQEGIYYKGKLIKPYETLYASTSSGSFLRGGYYPCRTIKANSHDLSICIPYDDYNSKIQNDTRIIRTITQQAGASAPRNNYKLIHMEQNTHRDFRIRKLTPRECFRLMDVSEENIDKIQAAGISNSQQYKMAGNSIVVSCLVGIFRQMFMPVVYEDISENIIQTSLFDDPNFL